MWIDCNTFSWRGERINDHKSWARERGEKIVRYKFSVEWPDGSIEWGHGEMPESFWGNLRFANERIEVERYDP